MILPSAMDVQASLDPSMKIQLKEGAQYAAKKMVQKIKGSEMFNRKSAESLPWFQMSEITLGYVIGHGEFCNVQEVVRFNIDENPIPKHISTREHAFFFLEGSQKAELSAKKTMALNCLQKGKSSQQNGTECGSEKYVIKCLKTSTKMNKPQYQRGLLDLTIETKVLSILSHPNIIRLKGFSRYELFQHDYFIIVEKLDCTLRHKLDHWKKTEGNNAGFFRKLIERKKKKNSSTTLKEKLAIFRDLASALAYMHSIRIIHRDLKPLNVGFNCEGEVKLFDFGLATELRNDRMNLNGLYRLSGNTGTRRYMAPEISRREPYNESCDVYSFAILLWEMLAMRTPFEGYTMDMFQIFVATMGDRLDLDPSWPAALQAILVSCWAHDCRKRMKCSEIFESLNNLMEEL